MTNLAVTYGRKKFRNIFLHNFINLKLLLKVFSEFSYCAALFQKVSSQKIIAHFLLFYTSGTNAIKKFTPSLGIPYLGV